MKGTLSLSYGVFDSLFTFDYDKHYPQKYNIDFEMIDHIPFDEILANSHSKLEEAIDVFNEICEDEEEKKVSRELKKDISRLVSDIESVELLVDLDEAIDYIKRNPSLRKKKIILSVGIELEQSIINKLKSEFDSFDNIYFSIPGNKANIGFQEYADTVERIDCIVNEIKSLSLSPLETIMFVYDLVKEHIYQEVLSDEVLENSRDLSKVLLGNKIVCVGYTKVFNVILKKLGYRTFESDLDSTINENGHLRSAVYVDDSKYKVKGVYFFDPTWDSKSSENDKTYFYSYRYFALTKEQIDKIDEEKKLVDIDFPCFYDGIVLKFEEGYRQNGFSKMSDSMIRSLNRMHYMVRGKKILQKMITNPRSPYYNRFNLDKTIDDLLEDMEYFRHPIYADTFLKALYNVRKAEYQMNKRNYPFSGEDFMKTMIVSKWTFDNVYVRLMNAMGMERGLTRNELYAHFRNFMESEKLEEQIQLVKKNN